MARKTTTSTHKMIFGGQASNQESDIAKRVTKILSIVRVDAKGLISKEI